MKRVVVVEADPVAREAAAGVLRDLNLDVDTVADGAHAMRDLRRTPPDAYLVGETLSSAPASAFVHTCRQTPGFANVPIVVMAVTPRAAIDAIREGAQACVRKPLDTGGAVAALHDLLHEDPPDR